MEVVCVGKSVRLQSKNEMAQPERLEPTRLEVTRTDQVDGTDQLEKLPAGFLVETEVKMTPDKGLGVFAAQFIPANSWVYKSDPVAYSAEEAAVCLNTLPTREEQQNWIDHAYGSKGKVCVDHNDLDLINHSRYPTMCNLGIDEISVRSYGVAVRDLYEGEELTEDYRTYSPTPALGQLCETFGIIDMEAKEWYNSE